MNVGIVGPEQAKFTSVTEEAARKLIRDLLANSSSVMVSGHCHLGGIDIFAEEEADKLGREKIIYPPKNHNWSTGYKPRNIQIAKTSDVVNVIVLKELPSTYRGMRFAHCYHCNLPHVKSGGCWTGHYAIKVGNDAKWFLIQPDGVTSEIRWTSDGVL
jgi:hypothetical protein